MSIYTDRGVFRVEVTLKGEKYRGRFKDYKEARIQEALWKAGQSLPKRKDEAPAAAAPGVPGERPRTLEALLAAGKQHLWLKQKDRDTSANRCQIFLAYLGLDRDPMSLRQADIDRAVRRLEDTQITGATINRYLSVFNVLTKWGEKRGFCKTFLMEWHPESKGRIRTVSQAEERQLLDLMHGYGRSDIAALITIALTTGMRQGELLKIRLEDLQGARVTLGDTKNGDTHYLTLPEPTLKLLVWYLTECEPVGDDECRYWWDRARAEMGLADDPWFTWHAMRHTAATRALKAGVDVRVVQKMLNHKRIETTLRYTHVDDTQIANALVALSGVSSRETPVFAPPPAFGAVVAAGSAGKNTRRKTRKRLPTVAPVANTTPALASGGRGGTGRRAGFRFQPIVEPEDLLNPSDD